MSMCGARACLQSTTTARLPILPYPQAQKESNENKVRQAATGTFHFFPLPSPWYAIMYVCCCFSFLFFFFFSHTLLPSFPDFVSKIDKTPHRHINTHQSPRPTCPPLFICIYACIVPCVPHTHTYTHVHTHPTPPILLSPPSFTWP